MNSGNDLYQRIILDHNRNPRNFRKTDGATHACDGYNPLCGDEITLYLTLADNVIQDISFQGSGCAISKAATSLMTGQLKGKTIDESREIADRFLKLVKGEPETGDRDDILGKLKIFEGVRQYPSRIKCATLPWHTMTCALDKKRETTTE
ncbi:Putative iron-sulfur cluster assembly scaffold protein for SUF system, SufE2 [hydrothermal vent metagenome]|uniref:Iron-sulfur cluster assembly scaffold protein for SUF system, SufE2 n=1 Tax=hydrothermal vent metagenome TaxID=652676 RepID=A0A3B1CAN4_9ZZZZ